MSPPTSIPPTSPASPTPKSYATSGTQQVGYGSGTGTGNNSHALLWNGTAASATDLNPTNFASITTSFCRGTSGTQQVGYGYYGNVETGYEFHALLWSGTAASAVDLNPTNLGRTTSFAYGTNGTQQVGYGYGPAGPGNNFYSHALLWNGSSIATDLHPTNFAGFTVSYAYGIGGTQQVGFGFDTNTDGALTDGYHALLWNGTADSAIDLNPTNLTGLTNSHAYATNGTQQVGYGDTGSGTNTHALLWNGTSVATDLSALLTPSYTSSYAFSLDASGNVFGTAIDSFGNTHAIEWVASPQATPLPSPIIAGLAGVAGLAAVKFRRRQGPFARISPRRGEGL